MTELEIEQAIKDNKTLWATSSEYCGMTQFKLVEISDTNKCELIGDILEDVSGYTYDIYDIYDNKYTALHALNHWHITRTEHLKYISWEAFKSGQELSFFDCKYNKYLLTIFNDSILLIDIKNWYGTRKTFELNEKGFYEAYEECRKIMEKTND